MAYTVEFAPEALEQLAALYRYIATAASPEMARRYTDAIVTYCEELQTFPHRGNQRHEIRPGLRITNYRKRTVIAFAVEAELVSILGVFMADKTLRALCRVDWTIKTSSLSKRPTQAPAIHTNPPH